jgi:hypothetical protein
LKTGKPTRRSVASAAEIRNADQQEDQLANDVIRRVAVGTRPVQLTVAAYSGLLVFSLSLSYGVWPPRPPWGRL